MRFQSMHGATKMTRGGRKFFNGLGKGKRSKCVTSTSGRLTVPERPGGEKKPHQKKRPVAERVTPRSSLAPSDLQKACRYRDRHGRRQEPNWKDAPGGKKYYPSYNIPPGSHTPVLFSSKHCDSSADSSERVLQPMLWGLIPSWHKGSISEKSYLTNNCRAEGMLEKMTYKVPLEKGRRCVVLAEGFYEWKRGKDSKQPYYIYFPQNKESNNNQTKVKVEGHKVKVEDVKVKTEEDRLKIKKEDSGFYETGSSHDKGSLESEIEGDYSQEEDCLPRLLTMAGVFDVWQPKHETEPVYSYSVITVESSPAMSWIHHRMPAILTSEEAVSAWLDFGEVPLAKAAKLIRPVTCLESHPVSASVNNSRNNTPECIKKIDTSKPKPCASSNLMSAWLTKGKVKQEKTEEPPDKKQKFA